MRTLSTIFAAWVVFALPLLVWGQDEPAMQPTTAPATQPSGGSTAIIPIHGEINELTKEIFTRNFREAVAAGADTIVIHLHTPGGMVSAGEAIASFLRRQSDVHTVAYIDEYAYSAGTMIAVAADEIVMHEYGKLGDAAPIAIGPTGLQPLPQTERAKVQSPVLTEFETSAEHNNYPPLLLRAMVIADLSVYWIENTETGDRRFVDEATFNRLTDTSAWKPVEIEGFSNPIDGPETLLTINGRRAHLIGLASELVPSLQALVEDRGYRVIATYEPGASQLIVNFLASEWLRAILLTLFLTSLYISLHSPGQGFPEVIALVTLAVLIGVPLLTGYAQWWEIIAILGGIALLAVELFVLPGFGVFGFLGLALIAIGFLFTFVAPEPGRSPFSLPDLPVTWQSIRNGLTVLVAGLAASLLLSMWLRRYLPKLPYFNRLILTTTVGGSDRAMVGSLTNIDPADDIPAIGAAGTAVTDLRPGGSARFTDRVGQSHVVSVVSDSGFVTHNTPVVVREVAGSRIVVRPAPERQQPSSEEASS